MRISEKSISRLAIILLLFSIVIVSLVSIILLDFRDATSDTKIDSQVGIASSNKAEIDLTGALSLTRFIIGTEFAISWREVGVLLVIAVLLLALTSYLTRFLSKERIVTTIA